MYKTIEIKLKIDKIIVIQNRNEEIFFKRQRLSENSVTRIEIIVDDSFEI